MKKIIKIKKINENGKINMPAYKGDAGYDVFATQSIILNPLQRFAMPLGIAIEFSNDLVCQVNQKSGLATKKGFDTIGNVIDSNYRDEIHAIIVNTSNEELFIEKGTKIAQLIFLKCETPEIEFCDELSSSDRNKNKFGSSGEK